MYAIYKQKYTQCHSIPKKQKMYLEQSPESSGKREITKDGQTNGKGASVVVGVVLLPLRVGCSVVVVVVLFIELNIW